MCKRTTLCHTEAVCVMHWEQARFRATSFPINLCFLCCRLSFPVLLHLICMVLTLLGWCEGGIYLMTQLGVVMFWKRCSLHTWRWRMALSRWHRHVIHTQLLPQLSGAGTEVSRSQQGHGTALAAAALCTSSCTNCWWVLEQEQRTLLGVLLEYQPADSNSCW